jgi:hypothetical protein
MDILADERRRSDRRQKEDNALKKIVFIRTLAAALAAVALLGGCGSSGAKAEPSETAKPAATPAPAETESPAETGTVPQRQDGERYDAVIYIEGMEETVPYEHIRNESLGIEMDYDYELFERHSAPDSECFICVYDPEQPENYLEVTRSAQDAETAAAAIGEALSKDYEISSAPYTLDSAGECIRIDASADVGGLTMPDQLQLVYIIPAADGCRIVTAHYAIEGADGFGKRFSSMAHTLSVID